MHHFELSEKFCHTIAIWLDGKLAYRNTVGDRAYPNETIGDFPAMQHIALSEGHSLPFSLAVQKQVLLVVV